MLNAMLNIASGSYKLLKCSSRNAFQLEQLLSFFQSLMTNSMKPKMKKLSKAEEFLKLIFEEQIPCKEITQLSHGKVLSTYSRSEKLDSLFTALDKLGEM